MRLRPNARLLNASEISTLRKLLSVFAAAFEDDDAYLSKQPSDDYLNTLLSQASFISVAGYLGETIAGGLVGYVLQKPEQERSEIYIYDLAVLEKYRRQGVASAMIERLQIVAKARGIYVIYVQADYEDEAAIALYTKLGKRKDVRHFDIPLSTSDA